MSDDAKVWTIAAFVVLLLLVVSWKPWENRDEEDARRDAYILQEVRELNDHLERR